VHALHSLQPELIDKSPKLIDYQSTPHLSSICESEKFVAVLEPAQIRAARALLGWRQEDLSKAAEVGTATIHRLEKSAQIISGYASTLARIQAAFEAAGILFIEDDGALGIGVRIAKSRKRPPSRSRAGPRTPK
jgi:hypothetical protein